MLVTRVLYTKPGGEKGSKPAGASEKKEKKTGRY